MDDIPKEMLDTAALLAGYLRDELTVGEPTKGVESCICLVPNMVEVVGIERPKPYGPPSTIDALMKNRITVRLASNEKDVCYRVKEAVMRFFEQTQSKYEWAIIFKEK